MSLCRLLLTLTLSYITRTGLFFLPQTPLSEHKRNNNNKTPTDERNIPEQWSATADKMKYDCEQEEGWNGYIHMYRQSLGFWVLGMLFFAAHILLYRCPRAR